MIINSLLDNDLYKFSMQQCVYHQYPNVDVKYKFKCRNNDLLKNKLSSEFIHKFVSEIYHLCSLEFSKEEIDYLKSIPFFKSDYIEYLKTFKLNKDNIKIYLKDEELKIDIEGLWLDTILFEIPILSIISEIYCNIVDIWKENFITTGYDNLRKKISILNNSDIKIKFSDFGTRRRFSFEFQNYVIKELLNKCEDQFLGTSNVYLSKMFNTKPIGTVAHEWIMSFQQLSNKLEDFQKESLKSWLKEYNNELAIALTDCITMDAFLRDFDLDFCNLFNGCRHDSGDPYIWCNKLINHYINMGIDPKTKIAIFSDNLTIEKAIDLTYTFGHKINVIHGIGTNLTNDCRIVPLQNVIKMVECNGKPVAKISDSPGKGMCEDEKYLSYLKKVFNVK